MRALAGKNKVAQLVEDMLSAVQSEMGRYQRIITYWPMYGPDLERAVTDALREATMGVSRQCGLVQIKVGGLAAGAGWWVVAACLPDCLPACLPAYLPGDTR